MVAVELAFPLDLIGITGERAGAVSTKSEMLIINWGAELVNGKIRTIFELSVRILLLVGVGNLIEPEPVGNDLLFFGADEFAASGGRGGRGGARLGVGVVGLVGSDGLEGLAQKQFVKFDALLIVVKLREVDGSRVIEKEVIVILASIVGVLAEVSKLATKKSLGSLLCNNGAAEVIVGAVTLDDCVAERVKGFDF